jgi:chitinase
VLLLSEMRTAIEREARNSKKDRLLLTAAVNIGTYIAGLAYDIPRVHPHVDYLLLMAYDLHGDWQVRMVYGPDKLASC